MMSSLRIWCFEAAMVVVPQLAFLESQAAYLAPKIFKQLAFCLICAPQGNDKMIYAIKATAN
jgi:hypothetical protein